MVLDDVGRRMYQALAANLNRRQAGTAHQRRYHLRQSGVNDKPCPDTCKTAECDPHYQECYDDWLACQECDEGLKVPPKGGHQLHSELLAALDRLGAPLSAGPPPADRGDGLSKNHPFKKGFKFPCADKTCPQPPCPIPISEQHGPQDDAQCLVGDNGECLLPEYCPDNFCSPAPSKGKGKSKDSTPDWGLPAGDLASVPMDREKGTSTATYYTDEHGRQVVNPHQLQCKWSPGDSPCNEIFPDTAVFHQHLMDHAKPAKKGKRKRDDGGGRPGHPCLWMDCERIVEGKPAFGQVQHLKEHLRGHSKHRPAACPVEHCQYRCFTAGELKQHDRTHEKRQPFRCDVCGARFAHTSSLRSHAKTHTDESAPQCPHCDKYRGWDAANMKRHIATHYPPTLFCAWCGRSAGKAGNLRRHHTSCKVVKQHRFEGKVVGDDLHNPEVAPGWQIVRAAPDLPEGQREPQKAYYIPAQQPVDMGTAAQNFIFADAMDGQMAMANGGLCMAGPASMAGKGHIAGDGQFTMDPGAPIGGDAHMAGGDPNMVCQGSMDGSVPMMLFNGDIHLPGSSYGSDFTFQMPM